MRTRSLLSTLLITVSVPALAAVSQNKPINMNDWHVAPMMAAGSTSPNYCAMASHYANGPVVTFTRNSVGKGSIAVDFANAQLEKGKRYAVTLITGNESTRYKATAISTKQVVIQTGLNPALHQHLANGGDLIVSLDGTDGLYTLAGNTRAFFEFDHCVKALGPTTDMPVVADIPVQQETLPSALQHAAPVATMAATSLPMPTPLPNPMVMAPRPVPETPAAVAQAAPSAPIVLHAPAGVAAFASEAPAATPSATAANNPNIVYETIDIASVTAPIAPLPAPLPTEKTQEASYPDRTIYVASTKKPNIEYSPEVMWGSMPPVPKKQEVAATKTKTEPAKEKTVAATSVKAPETKKAVTEPDVTQASLNKTSPKTLAATETAAGKEAETRSILKSKLASARAEASGLSATSDLTNSDPVAKTETKRSETKIAMASADSASEIADVTPVPAPIPTPAPKKAEIVKAAAPKIEEETFIAETPAIPVALAQKNTNPAPQSTSTIQNLLFDDGNAPVSSTAHETSPAPVKTTSKPKIAKTKPAPIALPEPQPVKQEIVTPKAETIAPAPRMNAKEAAPQETPAVVPQEEALEFTPPPSTQDVMPVLPPPSQAPMAVEKETTTKVAAAMPPARQLNTVTPSVGQPATYASSTESMQTAFAKPRSISFTPSPSSPVSAWRTRQVDALSKKAEDSFCLMESAFDNDTKLMIGQRSDAFSTLGLNYGIDMLQPGRDYTVSIQVDNSFEENFTGYAETARTLVIQLGKKNSFFQSLSQADAMRVAMPGVASTFALRNLSQALNDFSSCLVAIGGQTLVPSLAHQRNDAIVPNEPVEVATLDQTPSAAQPEEKIAAVPTPKPIQVPIKPQAEVISTKSVERTYQPLNAPVPAQTETKTAEILWDKKPAKAEAPNVVQTAEIEKAKTESAPSWFNDARALLADAGIQDDVTFEGDKAVWTQGKVEGTVTSLGTTDILDGADAALAKAEKACNGTFSAQMGVPETYGTTTAQPMESKCVNNDQVNISTWVVQQSENGSVTSIQMEAPREQRAPAFRLRDKLLSILKKADKTASIDSSTDKHS